MKNRCSAALKRKILARWRVLSARGMDIEEAAAEIGVDAADLRTWSRDTAGGPLLVEVQIDEGPSSAHNLVVVLRHGVRVEGLSIADVATLARLLS